MKAAALVTLMNIWIDIHPIKFYTVLTLLVSTLRMSLYNHSNLLCNSTHGYIGYRHTHHHHDYIIHNNYTHVTSMYVFQQGKIDHCCLVGGDDKCRWYNPLMPKNWLDISWHTVCQNMVIYNFFFFLSHHSRGISDIYSLLLFEKYPSIDALYSSVRPLVPLINHLTDWLSCVSLFFSLSFVCVSVWLVTVIRIYYVLWIWLRHTIHPCHTFLHICMTLSQRVHSITCLANTPISDGGCGKIQWQKDAKHGKRLLSRRRQNTTMISWSIAVQN